MGMTNSPIIALIVIAVLLLAAHLELASQSSTDRALHIARAEWVVSP